MASEGATTAAHLIAEAFKQSGLSQRSFGVWLEKIALDFKQGKADQPERVN